MGQDEVVVWRDFLEEEYCRCDILLPRWITITFSHRNTFKQEFQVHLKTHTTRKFEKSINVSFVMLIPKKKGTVNIMDLYFYSLTS